MLKNDSTHILYILKLFLQPPQLWPLKTLTIPNNLCIVSLYITLMNIPIYKISYYSFKSMLRHQSFNTKMSSYQDDLLQFQLLQRWLPQACMILSFFVSNHPIWYLGFQHHTSFPQKNLYPNGSYQSFLFFSVQGTQYMKFGPKIKPLPLIE